MPFYKQKDLVIRQYTGSLTIFYLNSVFKSNIEDPNQTGIFCSTLWYFRIFQAPSHCCQLLLKIEFATQK